MAAEVKAEETNAFTPDQLREAWNEFAGQRKQFQVEYQLFNQPYDLNGNRVILHLLSPVQETMLNNIKSELTTHLREKLKNSTLLVTGQLIETDQKKMMYTDSDKLEFMLDKNPIFKEMKERLGLDTF